MDMEKSPSTYSSSGSDAGKDVAHNCKTVPADEIEPAIYNEGADISGIDERALVRKLDRRLIPWLSFLYLLSFLGRTSIGNAKLYGLGTDIHISNDQYNIGVMIFFFSYAIFEIPSNIFLKRLRPSLWLSSLMLLGGIAMTCQGLIHNYSGLLASGWWLGTFEAGLYPGVSFYLSCWYKRSEFGLRAAIFFSAATVSGAFGGLLAAAIANMDGIGGKPGWAWIFIVEGLVAIVAGAASFWIIQDFPDNARFLTEVERTVVIRRLLEDDQFSAAGETLLARNLWSAVRDWRTWLCMLIYGGVVGPLYAFALFLPSIINELGYTATRANLLSVPVFSVACLFTVVVVYFSDKRQQRGYVNMGLLCLAGTGYIILIMSRNPALSYVATYMAACGIYPAVPNSIAWVSNNVEGSYKRAVALGMVCSFANLNGAVSSNIYRAKDKPWYSLGHGIVLLYIVLGLASSIVYAVTLRRENVARERGERDEVIDPLAAEKVGTEEDEQALRNGRYASVEDAKRDKGDRWSGYRYTL